LAIVAGGWSTSMNSIRELVRRSPLAAFFVIACGLTWIGWTVPQQIYAQTPLTFLLALPFSADGAWPAPGGSHRHRDD